MDDNQVYDKSSFDRFGDDLTELIISYLTIEDKFRFQCLNKRIDKLIFNMQTILNVSKTFKSRIVNGRLAVDLQHFEKTLLKLKRLTAINISEEFLVECQVLRLIADHCPHVTELTLAWTFNLFNTVDNEVNTRNTIDYFGTRVGPKLKKLTLMLLSNKEEKHKLKRFFSYCPNLVELTANDLSMICNDVSENWSKILPKLKSIKCRIINEIHLNALKTQFPSTLIAIRSIIWTTNLDSNNIRTVMTQFGRFRDLQTLELHISFSDSEENPFIICQSLRQLSERCNKLKTMFISIAGNLEDDNYLEIFQGFYSLQSLSVRLTDQMKNNKSSIEGLGHLSGLRHLRLEVNTFTEEGYENIGQYLPNLQSISLKTEIQISDNIFLHLSQLKKLRYLEIVQNLETFKPIDTNRIIQMNQMLESCQNLRRFGIRIIGIKSEYQLPISSYITEYTEINEPNIESFKSLANNWTRIAFQLEFSFKTNESKEKLQYLTKRFQPSNSCNLEVRIRSFKLHRIKIL